MLQFLELNSVTTNIHLGQNRLSGIEVEMAAYLVTCRHILHLLTPRPPIIRLQLRVFDPLLTPILMQLADVVLALLEEEKFVSDALLDKHPPRVLVHD